MAFQMEDLTCKDCGTHWSDENGNGWYLQFTDDRPPGQNLLKWAQCPACQPDKDRFAVSVASDIHWLPETP